MDRWVVRRAKGQIDRRVKGQIDRRVNRDIQTYTYTFIHT